MLRQLRYGRTTIKGLESTAKTSDIHTALRAGSCALGATSALSQACGELDPWLPKADTGTSTVFINELYPRGFESSLDHFQSGAAWTARSILQLMNCNGANSSSLSEILLAPRD